MGDDVDISALTIEQYLALIQDNNRSGIVKPKIGDAIEFEINNNFIRELRRKFFAGTDDEDAHEHVWRVLEVVDLFHFPSVTHDAVMLRAFPITFKGRALRWKKRLPVGVINTWDLLEKEFICFKEAHLTKEFPLKKEDKAVEQSKKSIENMDSNIRALRTTTKNLQEKDYQLTQTVLTNTGEKVKARTTMGKESTKDPVPRDLPVVQTYAPPILFLGHLKG
ncbi:hypothetical protein Tco_0304562 [Tanacetum coccineum]